jgi:hypothetical protein
VKTTVAVIEGDLIVVNPGGHANEGAKVTLRMPAALDGEADGTQEPTK